MITEVRERDEYRSHVDRIFPGTSGICAGGQVMDTTVIEEPVERAVIRTGDGHGPRRKKRACTWS
ncbi:hypothetical protein ACFVTC_40825 [Streptomyces sp. NPDC057950]|uniref:hypothetical protein n=1 Tax=Streptomyces sp. NPDC057950 TaxID=3346288 RepID=UPI0036EDD843